MFDFESILWGSALVGVCGFILVITGVVILGRAFGLHWEHALGMLRVDDDLVDRIQRRVRLRAQGVPLRAHSRADAEAAIEREICVEIVDVFREAYPQHRWRVKSSWPRAFAILHNNGEVSVRLWIGLDYRGDGLEPVKVATAWRRTPDATEQIQKAIRRGQETVAAGADKRAKIKS